jgi:hypothetical protein
LSLSYGGGISKPREADNQVVPASYRVRSTVLLAKLGEVVMACFRVICEHSGLDGGVGDFNSCNIENWLYTKVHG